jgi:hypothetical protein
MNANEFAANPDPALAAADAQEHSLQDPDSELSEEALAAASGGYVYDTEFFRSY